MSSKNQISVTVPKISLNSQSSTGFKWSKATSVLKLDRIEEDISNRLFSDGRVVAILKRAFELGLSRNVAWDISEVDLDAASAFRVAAGVFKRGVPVVDNRFKVKSRRRSIITYDIDFMSRVSDCFVPVRDRDMVIVDQNVAKAWWRHLPKGSIALNFSESGKNITVAAAVVEVIRGRRALDSKVFVVGGGVAGDVVGFAAGVLGVACQFVPTTLLSMVDSSIGGKVGVNFEPWGKNQIGLFQHPLGVFIWPGWLESLDDKELKSGLVECLKHALISGDEGLWCAMSKPGKRIKMTPELLARIIEVKRGVVESDPYEKGERAVLNFGHTLGHALETVASARGIAVTHGECVAIGMVHALRLSVKYRGMDAGSLIVDLFKSKVVMPKETLSELNGGHAKVKALAKELIDVMIQDKKSINGASVAFVLLDAPGKISRSSDKSWVIQFPKQQAMADLEETLVFLLSLSY